MEIIKLENGNIALSNALGYFVSFPPTAKIETLVDSNIIQVFQSGFVVYQIDYSQVSATQILPAAKVVFDPATQKIAELLEILAKDFFQVPQCLDSGNYMLSTIYDSNGLGLDVYNKANETGVEQITGPIITPPTLSATTNNYNPVGFDTANMIRLNVNANNRQLTGLLAPIAGLNRIVLLNNINSGSLDLRIVHNSALSSASNRFLLRDGGGRSVKPNQTAAFWYDHISQRWRSLNRVQ